MRLEESQCRGKTGKILQIGRWDENIVILSQYTYFGKQSSLQSSK
jgi:hypothetical protein